jgi:DNA-directed RNA polymerase specialized sigma24 family protein
MPASSHYARDRFATTNWNLVGELKGPDGAAALAALCEQYWFPLYAFVRRKLGNDHDARDSTQAFFAWLLEKNLLRRAAADRGRLRSFLLTTLQNFLRNEYQAGRRQKRGGEALVFSLDFEEGSSQFAALPADHMTAERLYERTWALLLLDRVLLRLQDEMEAAGQDERFRILKLTLSGEQSESYGEMAAKLGTTEAAARQAVSRLRKRYRQLLLEEVQATVADPEDVDDEIHRLFAALAPA